MWDVMFGYYLYEEAFQHITETALLQNLTTLNELMVKLNDGYDRFYYSDSFWNVNVANGRTISDCTSSPSIERQFYYQVFPRMWPKLSRSELCNNIDEFKSKSEEAICALWGVIFKNKDEYCLSTSEEVYDFRKKECKKYVLKNKSKETFQKFFDVLFSNIKFCESAFVYICSYSEAEIRQILERLLEIDEFGSNWTSGTFPMGALNSKTNLRASFESASTNNSSRLRLMRTFTLPNGKSEYFEAHIKMGNFRIHFFPDESTHTIYIGYIGSHLDLS